MSETALCPWPLSAAPESHWKEAAPTLQNTVIAVVS